MVVNINVVNNLFENIFIKYRRKSRIILRLNNLAGEIGIVIPEWLERAFDFYLLRIILSPDV